MFQHHAAVAPGNPIVNVVHGIVFQDAQDCGGQIRISVPGLHVYLLRQGDGGIEEPPVVDAIGKIKDKIIGKEGADKPKCQQRGHQPEDQPAANRRFIHSGPHQSLGAFSIM